MERLEELVALFPDPSGRVNEGPLEEAAKELLDLVASLPSEDLPAATAVLFDEVRRCETSSFHASRALAGRGLAAVGGGCDRRDEGALRRSVGADQGARACR